MINEVLLEHEAPFLDGGQQSLFEWSDIHKKPCVDHFGPLKKTHKAVSNSCSQMKIYNSLQISPPPGKPFHSCPPVL